MRIRNGGNNLKYLPQKKKTKNKGIVLLGNNNKNNVISIVVIVCVVSYVFILILQSQLILDKQLQRVDYHHNTTNKRGTNNKKGSKRRLIKKNFIIRDDSIKNHHRNSMIKKKNSPYFPHDESNSSFIVGDKNQEERSIIITPENKDFSDKNRISKTKNVNGLNRIKSNNNKSNNNKDNNNNEEKKKFIIFMGEINGQGIGNAMNGLLATQLFGIESNRIVCISPNEFSKFFLAFDYRSTKHKKLCNDLLLLSDRKKLIRRHQDQSSGVSTNYIHILNYDIKKPNECFIKNMLLSNKEQYIMVYGNTYPQWPTTTTKTKNYDDYDDDGGIILSTTITTNLFHKYYKPKPSLLNILPWKINNNTINNHSIINNSTRSISSSNSIIKEKSNNNNHHHNMIVVHLRQGDNKGDIRNGLDDVTLNLLGKKLVTGGGGTKQQQLLQENDDDEEKKVFLVTNNVDWYKLFENKYGWLHSNWTSVKHSALSHIEWGSSSSSSSKFIQLIKSSSSNNNNSNDKITYNDIKKFYKQEQLDNERNKNMNILQMWSDWYVILNAKYVYHTHSDFSSSAIHWMDIPSKIIMGTIYTNTTKKKKTTIKNTGNTTSTTTTSSIDVEEELVLDLRDEPWRRRERRRHSSSSSEKHSSGGVANGGGGTDNNDADDNENNIMIIKPLTLRDNNELTGCSNSTTETTTDTTTSSSTITNKEKSKSKIRKAKIKLPVSRHQDKHGTKDSNNGKYLVFVGDVGGQGTGNIMNGLLAAHLFGFEFNRTVCILNYGVFAKSFFKAFQYNTDKFYNNDNTCDNIKYPDLKELQAEQEEIGIAANFHLLNYEPTPPNECHIKNVLSSAHQTIYFKGNTYPRWCNVPTNFFMQYYEPTDLLKSMLPWWNEREQANSSVEDNQSQQRLPHTVVHLRREDNFDILSKMFPDTDVTPFKDVRKGLDDASLTALGDLLPQNTTYLVTNDLTLYDMFKSKYGWIHPPWIKVSHTAYKALGSTRNGEDKNVTENTNTIIVNGVPLPEIMKKYNITNDDVLNKIQMWADWYTILVAKRVYHTLSDFSASAVHWRNNLKSKVIMGIKEEKNDTFSTTYIGGGSVSDIKNERHRVVDDNMLDLWDEQWVRDGVAKHLVDRDENELKSCISFNETKVKNLNAKKEHKGTNNN